MTVFLVKMYSQQESIAFVLIGVMFSLLAASLAARDAMVDRSFLEFCTLHDATTVSKCQGRDGILLYFDDVSFPPCHCSHQQVALVSPIWMFSASLENALFQNHLLHC